LRQANCRPELNLSGKQSLGHTRRSPCNTKDHQKQLYAESPHVAWFRLLPFRLSLASRYVFLHLPRHSITTYTCWIWVAV
jgi:hypothetical protein